MPQPAKRRPAATTTFAGNRQLPRRTGVILAAAFAVVFVGAGTIYVTKSLAASEGCAGGLYGYGSSGLCVQMIQRTMTDLNEYVQSANIPVAICNNAVPNHVYNLNQCNGVYGGRTVADIQDFQRTNFSQIAYGQPLTADGVVGFYTWRKLCYVSDYYIDSGHATIWDPEEGCQRWGL